MAPQAFANEGNFDFKVEDAGGGCVQITNITAVSGFPMVDNKVVSEITLHFSDVAAGSVVMQSPRYYLTVATDDNGNLSITPSKLCTLTGTGVRYFKYALWTESYDLVEWMPAADFDNAKHRVDIH
ncbi:MAG: hypothetical protein EOP05_14945 [Proteobacteria bacterium]|nr:MAG: hypothetical protein EOP05_14945 [Pseudomonadota bacterium]